MLPSIKTLRHSVYIEELKKKVEFRPMLVGEHKLIITAMGFNDEEALVNAIIDVIDNCTFNKLEIRKLPTHIVDFLYLNIFIKSNGEFSQVVLTCNNVMERTFTTESGSEKTEEVVCGKKFNVMVPLTKAEIFYPEDHAGSNIIMVNDTAGIKLKVPTMEDFKKVDINSQNLLDISDDFVFACVDSVFNEDEVQIPGKDFKPEEFKEWLDQAEVSVMDKINTFLKSMPVLSLDLPITCPSCGRVHQHKFRGLDDFF